MARAVAHWTLGRIHFTNGEFKAAHDLYRRVIELKPSFLSAFSDLKMTCERLGQQDEAQRVRGQLLELLPNHLLRNPDDARARIHYSVMLAEAGRADEALREGAQAQESSPGDPVMLYNVTCLFARLGDVRRAVDSLRQAIAAGYVAFAWINQDPDMNRLRDDPEFQTLIAGR